MSLPCLNNATDVRTPNQSGENVSHDDTSHPQPQPVSAPGPTAPTMRSPRVRLAEFGTHWASLQAHSPPTNEAPKSTPLPLPLLPVHPLPMASEPTGPKTRVTEKQDEKRTANLTASKTSVVSGIQTEKPASASSSAQKEEIELNEPHLIGNRKNSHKASGTSSESLTKEIARYKKLGRKVLAEAIKVLDFDAVSQTIRRDPALLSELDADGRTALGHAASLGSKEMVRHLLLLESRVTDGSHRAQSLVTLRDAGGCAPIHNAIDARHCEVIEELLKAGTPFDLRSECNQFPLLAYAASEDEAVVACLLKHLPAKMLDQKNVNGKTAMHIAAEQSKPGILRRLMKAGCRTDLPSNAGNTPLHLAARRSEADCARMLISVSTFEKINAVNGRGETALHRAAMAGNIETVRQLIKAGAKIDLPDGHGWTALATATDQGHLQIIKYLLKHEANPDFGNKFWAQPLTLALASGDQERINFFRYRGWLTFNRVAVATRRAISIGHSTMVEACLRPGNLDYEFTSERFLRMLLELAVERGNPEIMGLVCDKFKCSYRSRVVDRNLVQALLTAQEQRKIHLLLPLVQRIKQLSLDSDAFHMLISGAQARKDYALIEALTKTKLVVDGAHLKEIPDTLLPNLLARELMNQPKPPKASLASVFRKPKLPDHPPIDAINTASQLAVDLTSVDPFKAIETTLSAQKVSGLLHQPLASSLIPLCTAFASAGNLKLSQAQYVIGYGLAQYVDPAHLPLPAILDKVISANAILEKCHAHREALAAAGRAMMESAEGRISDDFFDSLARIAIGTPPAMNGDRSPAIADRLATDYGLLPIWAQRLGKVCTDALAATMSTYGRSFNTDHPPADLLAMLGSAILQHFVDATKQTSAPDGFRNTALAIDSAAYADFDELLWRQWDKITEAMAAGAQAASGMGSADSSTDALSGADSDELASSASE